MLDLTDFDFFSMEGPSSMSFDTDVAPLASQSDLVFLDDTKDLLGINAILRAKLQGDGRQRVRSESMVVAAAESPRASLFGSGSSNTGGSSLAGSPRSLSVGSPGSSMVLRSRTSSVAFPSFGAIYGSSISSEDGDGDGDDGSWSETSDGQAYAPLGSGIGSGIDSGISSTIGSATGSHGTAATAGSTRPLSICSVDSNPMVVAPIAALNPEPTGRRPASSILSDFDIDISLDPGTDGQ